MNNFIIETEATLATFKSKSCILEQYGFGTTGQQHIRNVERELDAVVNVVKKEILDDYESDKENEETLNLQDLNDAINCLAATAESSKENAGLSNTQDLNDAIDCLAAAAGAAAEIEDSNSKDSQQRNSQSIKLPLELKAIKKEENSDDEFYDARSNGCNVNQQQSTKKNLMLEWSTHAAFKEQQGCATSVAGALAAAPKAYIFKDIYQQKREEALRKREDEERKLREFRSRPMPNFKACHEKTMQRPIAHLVTCPLTPHTLKTWRAQKELRKQKQEEEELQKLNNTQKAKPGSVDYLRKQPFKPNLPEPTMVKQKPFQLGTEDRLQQRREYNATVQRAHEDLKNQLKIRRFVQTGRIVKCAAGPLKDLITIVDVIDQTSVPRQEYRLNNLHLSKYRIKFPYTAPTRIVRKTWVDSDLKAKWKAWSHKAQNICKRSQLSDFDRFKLRFARRQRNKLLTIVFNALKKRTKADGTPCASKKDRRERLHSQKGNDGKKSAAPAKK